MLQPSGTKPLCCLCARLTSRHKAAALPVGDGLVEDAEFTSGRSKANGSIDEQTNGNSGKPTEAGQAPAAP